MYFYLLPRPSSRVSMFTLKKEIWEVVSILYLFAIFDFSRFECGLNVVLFPCLKNELSTLKCFPSILNGLCS